MSELPLPKHVAERLERRWASRLACEAVTWLGGRPPLAVPQAIADRKGPHSSGDPQAAAAKSPRI
jgi:hypothetical protein